MKTQEIRCTHKRRKSAGADEEPCGRFLFAANQLEILVRCPVCKRPTRVWINAFGQFVQEHVDEGKHPILKMKAKDNG